MNGTIPVTIPSAAPSAAPATATPAAPVAATPAPATAAELDPANLAYYDRLASQSIQDTPAPAAKPATGIESPPVAAPAAAAPEPPAAAPVQTSEPDDAEPTPEALATMTDSEKRIFGALQKERSARKEAKAELKQTRESLDALKGELDGIKAKLNPDPNAPAGQPATAPSPVALGDCNTFEAVDARATQAVNTEALAERLQLTLAKGGAAAVVEALKQQGVTQLNGMPMAEASEEQVGAFLSSVKEGARLTQIQAGPRKQYLAGQAQAWNDAVKLVPELSDPKSARAQKFVAITNANPRVLAMGPNWPVVVAKYLLGDEASGKAAPAAQPAPVVQPQLAAPVIPTRTAPAAPTRSPAPVAQATELEQLRAKMENGTASLDEVDRYSVLSLNA